MERIFLLLLCSVLTPTLNAQTRAWADSLERLVQDRATPDTLKADLLVDLYSTAQVDTARASRYVKQLLPLLSKLERSADPLLQRKARRTHARYLYSQGDGLTYRSNFSMALRNYMRAWRMIDAPTDRETLDHYGHLQRLYELLGDTARMVKFGELMVPHALALRDTEAVLNTHMTIAIARPEEVDLDSIAALANAYYKSPVRRENFSWNIAWILEGQGKRAAVIAHLKKAIAEHGNGPVNMPYALMHWTLGENYGYVDSLEQGVATLKKALALTKEAGVEAWLGRERMMLGTLLVRLGREDEAEQAFRTALAELEASHQVRFELEAAGYLKDLLGRQGRAQEALIMTNKWILLKDSVDAMRAEEETARMEFDAEAQADSLASAHVLEQERQQAEARIARERTQRNVLLGFGAFGLVFAAVDYRRRRRIKAEHARSEALLLNILPEEVAEELKAKGHAEAVHIDQVTVLFTDFKGFTTMSETMSPQELVRDLNECFSAFDHITAKHGIEKIKTIGDAYMAAGGLPTPNTTHANDVVQAALEMRDFIAEGKARKVAAGLPYFEIRIGVHTGPVVAGIVGVKKFQYDIWGDTVNTASRMESSGEVGQVNISEATYALVKEAKEVVEGKEVPAFTFIPRGKVQAKGKGEMEMYFVQAPSHQPDHTR